jgi:hypothetical protein
MEQLIDIRLHNPQPATYNNAPAINKFQEKQESKLETSFANDYSQDQESKVDIETSVDDSFADSKVEEEEVEESKYDAKPISKAFHESKEISPTVSTTPSNNNNSNLKSLVQQKKFDELDKYLEGIDDSNDDLLDDNDGYNFLANKKKTEEKSSAPAERKESSSSLPAKNNLPPALPPVQNKLNALAPLPDVKIPSRFQVNLHDILSNELDSKDEKPSPVAQLSVSTSNNSVTVPKKSPKYDEDGPENSSDSDSFSQLDQEFSTKDNSPDSKEKKNIQQITVNSASSNNKLQPLRNVEEKESNNRAVVNKLSQVCGYRRFCYFKLD